MSYTSVIYLFMFLPAALIAYQLTPQKKRWLTLLMSGYLFFYAISEKLVLFLILTSVFTHYIGIWIDSQQSRVRKKQILIFGILTVLSVLVYLKYYNFFVKNTNLLANAAGKGDILQIKTLLLPIGISFYTLQAISYMVDIYWGKIKACQHPGKVALFLGFFPQIMEGPISMYSQTAETLWEGKSITAENLEKGSLRILWGLFKKMIIADRLYILVQAIFNNYQQYHGIMIVIGAVAYTVQLYMEFSGAIDIVIGSGRMFGVTIPENFRQPFASKNASEFWQRWHITLGVWFKTYIFYPVSVSHPVKKWNRFGKKHFGKYIAKLGISAACLFPVWLCNGLWHGAQWNYIFYGIYYFTILLLGIAVEPVRNKVLKVLHINEHVIYWQILQVLKTWVIIFTGELFFRANGLRAGLSMFRSLFQGLGLSQLENGYLFTLGMDKADYFAILAGCVIVGLVGMIKERNLLKSETFYHIWTPARWAVYYGLILSIVIFGAYGVGYQQVDLIYAGF